MDTKNYDIVIIGSGAAGLSSAIYAGRYKLKTLVIGKDFGGQSTWAGVIENYPGAKDVEGYALMKTMKEQASEVDVEFVDKEVETIDSQDRCFNVHTKDQAYHASAVVLALGSYRRRLGIPKEEELTGKGIHYCITCDGPLYSGKTIAVVGGGDAAVKGASLASEYADKIYMIVRGSELRAEPINKEALYKIKDKVEILYETNIKEILGDEKLEGIKLTKEYNNSDMLSLDGLFIEIGADPNTKSAANLNLNLDHTGHIEVDNKMKTNIDGVYAAGDVVTHFGHFKQIVTAAAMGAMAATSAYEHCKKCAGLCVHDK